MWLTLPPPAALCVGVGTRLGGKRVLALHASLHIAPNPHSYRACLRIGYQQGEGPCVQMPLASRISAAVRAGNLAQGIARLNASVCVSACTSMNPNRGDMGDRAAARCSGTWESVVVSERSGVGCPRRA
jgi:hypothetical protein